MGEKGWGLGELEVSEFCREARAPLWISMDVCGWVSHAMGLVVVGVVVVVTCFCGAVVVLRGGYSMGTRSMYGDLLVVRQVSCLGAGKRGFDRDVM